MYAAAGGASSEKGHFLPKSFKGSFQTAGTSKLSVIQIASANSMSQIELEILI